MDVYERSRQHLHQRLQEALGPEAAGTLMAHLPAGGIERLATKDDIQRLEQKSEADKQQLRAEMQQVGRSLTLSLITMMTIINGVVFTALTFAFR